MSVQSMSTVSGFFRFSKTSIGCILPMHVEDNDRDAIYMNVFKRFRRAFARRRPKPCSTRSAIDASGAREEGEPCSLGCARRLPSEHRVADVVDPAFSERGVLLDGRALLHGEEGYARVARGPPPAPEATDVGGRALRHHWPAPRERAGAAVMWAWRSVWCARVGWRAARAAVVCTRARVRRTRGAPRCVGRPPAEDVQDCDRGCGVAPLRGRGILGEEARADRHELPAAVRGWPPRARAPRLRRGARRAGARPRGRGARSRHTARPRGVEMFIKNMPIHIHIYMHVHICIQARIRIHTYNVCVARRASMLAPALPPPREHARTRHLICISIIVLEHIASQGPDIAVPPSAVSSESRTSPSRSDGDAAGGDGVGSGG